jgi:hypothetical protein
MRNCEEAVQDISGGKPLLVAFLRLSSAELSGAAESIDCPYCREHMRLEAEEVRRVLSRIDSDGNIRHHHGLVERFQMMGNSVNIIANVLLGGLRRAGVI